MIKKVEPPKLLLAEKWDNELDPTGWWMSEKLDGVRAYWDGKQFISRNGSVYAAPDWFCKVMPNIPLDGELWGGRKNFQKATGIIRRHDNAGHLWIDITYMVFDVPTHNEVFESRINFCDDVVRKAQSGIIQLHKHELCKNVQHLKTTLENIELLGGEGLMLRKPGSLYETKRSPTLLKVKTFHDAEAKVVEYLPGKGRNKGRIGALIVELSNGIRFSVGTGLSDEEREKPPAIGSTITYRYQELSDGGVPRFPSFVCERLDI